MEPSCDRSVLDGDPNRAAPAQGVLEDPTPGVRQVIELTTREGVEVREPRVVQDGAHEGLVAPQDQTTGYAARQDPQRVVGDRPDELVGLVVAPPGKALLGPATGGGPRLDVPLA